MAVVSVLQNVVSVSCSACIIGHAGSQLYAVAYVLALLRHGPRDRWRKRGAISTSHGLRIMLWCSGPCTLTP